MRVGRDETIAGVRLIWVRDFLRWIDGRAVRASNIAERLGCDPVEAEAFHKALIDAGYIEVDAETDQAKRPSRYIVSELGIQLCNARFVRRIARQEAEKLIAGLLERVRQVNERDELTHRVTCIRVFGSFLSDSPDLGDVDLAVQYTPRRATHIEEAKQRAEQSGKSINSYLQLITFGRQEVRQLLKNRQKSENPRVSRGQDDPGLCWRRLRTNGLVLKTAGAKQIDDCERPGHPSVLRRSAGATSLSGSRRR